MFSYTESSGKVERTELWGSLGDGALTGHQVTNIHGAIVVPLMALVAMSLVLMPFVCLSSPPVKLGGPWRPGLSFMLVSVPACSWKSSLDVVNWMWLVSEGRAQCFPCSDLQQDVVGFQSLGSIVALDPSFREGSQESCSVFCWLQLSGC